MCARYSILTKWWRIKSAFAFVLFVTYQVQSHAQIIQSTRIEISLSSGDEGFEVINAYQDGLYIFRRLLLDNEEVLDLIKLDSTCEQRWRGQLPITPKYILMGKKVEKNLLYLLFRFQDYSKNDFELFVIDQANGKYVKYIIKNFIPFSPNDFQVTEKAVLIGGYFNRVPVVIYFSLATEKTKVLPGLFNETGELTQVRTYEDGTIDVLISGLNIKGQKTIWVKNYDPDGDLLSNQALEPEDNKNLIFARSIKTDNQLQLIAGVYGGRNTEYSRGMFMASIDPSGMQNIRYYNFGDLENFFKFMRAKRELRVKNRIERRKIKGKKIRFNYRIMVHQIVPYNNQYILLGEAFYPRYTTMDRSYYSGFFNPLQPGSYFTRDGRIFDGYYYTHAVVMGFSNDGDLLWDNSFEINDVKTFTLEQFVKLEVQKDKIALLYLFENQLRTKIIKGNQVLEGKTSEPIETKVANDVVKNHSTDRNHLDYWYNQYFYAYGIQEISNPKFGQRRVFFINKVSYK
ncbi:MAG: hypothetical protein ABI663_22535 [Chryseolinea sp.]